MIRRIQATIALAKFLSTSSRVRTGRAGCRAADRVGPKSGLPLFTIPHWRHLFPNFLALSVRIPLFQCVRHTQKWTHLRYTDILICTGDVARDVFQGDRVLDGELVRLALDAGAVDEDARVGRQPGEGHHHVVVQQADLAHRPLLLQLRHRFLLHAEHHQVAAAHAHLTTSETHTHTPTQTTILSIKQRKQHETKVDRRRHWTRRTSFDFFSCLSFFSSRNSCETQNVPFLPKNDLKTEYAVLVSIS